MPRPSRRISSKPLSRAIADFVKRSFDSLDSGLIGRCGSRPLAKIPIPIRKNDRAARLLMSLIRDTCELLKWYLLCSRDGAPHPCDGFMHAFPYSADAGSSRDREG